MKPDTSFSFHDKIFFMKKELNQPPPPLDSGVPDKLPPEDPLPPGVLSPTS